MMSRLLSLLIAVLLAACSRLDPPGPNQPLVVGVPDDPVFQAAAPGEGMDGFSRDLVGMFAKNMNVQVRFVTAPDYPSLLAMVVKGKVHIAATIPIQEDEPKLRFTPPLRETRHDEVVEVKIFGVALKGCNQYCR